MAQKSRSWAGPRSCLHFRPSPHLNQACIGNTPP
jgi:hypothetical protein